MSTQPNDGVSFVLEWKERADSNGAQGATLPRPAYMSGKELKDSLRDHGAILPDNIDELISDDAQIDGSSLRLVAIAEDNP